jgi:hypothetical protein
MKGTHVAFSHVLSTHPWYPKLLKGDFPVTRIKEFDFLELL